MPLVEFCLQKDDRMLFAATMLNEVPRLQSLKIVADVSEILR